MVPFRSARLMIGAILLLTLSSAVLVGRVSAADDGGGEYMKNLIGTPRADPRDVKASQPVLVNGGLQAPLTIEAPAIYTAAAGNQSVRWMPILQIWSGGRWYDFGTSSWSQWGTSGTTAFGPVSPSFPAAKTTLVLNVKGTYYIRVGYRVQWYWNAASITEQRLINRSPRLYQGPPNHLLENPYLTYVVR